MSPALYWTRDLIIDAIQEFNRIYDRLPSAMDWNVAMARNAGRPDLVDRFYADACWPHTGSVYGRQGRFESWNAAIEAAGFTPRAWGERGETSDYAIARGAPTRINRTHCIHGHEFTPENTRVVGDGRRCRECERINNRAAYARRVARIRGAA